MNKDAITQLISRERFITLSKQCAINVSTLVRTGAGEITAITAFSTSATIQAINLYDNTSASGFKLLEIFISSLYPVIIIFPKHLPLKFSTGLTVDCPANANCFVLYLKKY